MNITNIYADARERAREETKARVREKNNTLQRTAAEASVNIREIRRPREQREKYNIMRQVSRLIMMSR